MSEYRFTRYVNGEERAEGICIKRKSNLKDAVRAAVDLVYADERPVTVLVLDDKRIAELEAERRNLLDTDLKAKVCVEQEQEIIEVLLAHLDPVEEHHIDPPWELYTQEERQQTRIAADEVDVAQQVIELEVIEADLAVLVEDQAEEAAIVAAELSDLAARLDRIDDTIAEFGDLRPSPEGTLGVGLAEGAAAVSAVSS